MHRDWKKDSMLREIIESMWNILRVYTTGKRRQRRQKNQTKPDLYTLV